MEKIKLSQYGRTFSLRETAEKIFSAVQATEIEVDFTDVQTATPSFCDQLLEILVNQKKAKLRLSNANESVKLQLQKALSAFNKNPRG